jgi:hypothetical protein
MSVVLRLRETLVYDDDVKVILVNLYNPKSYNLYIPALIVVHFPFSMSWFLFWKCELRIQICTSFIYSVFEQQHGFYLYKFDTLCYLTLLLNA